MPAEQQGNTQEDKGQEFDIVAPAPEVERYQRAHEHRGRDHEAARRWYRQPGDRPESQQADQEEHDPSVERHSQKPAGEPDRNAGQNRQGKVGQVMQCRVGKTGEPPGHLGERGVRPVDTIDRLAMHEALDGRLCLDQAVVLDGQPETWPLDDPEQRRSQPADRDQPVEQALLERPVAAPEQQEGEEETDPAGGRQQRDRGPEAGSKDP